MEKMDLKYQDTIQPRDEVSPFRLDKIARGGMFSYDILPLKSVQKGSSVVDEHSVHLETKCHSGRCET
jgi:hypothetical protein